VYRSAATLAAGAPAPSRRFVWAVLLLLLATTVSAQKLTVDFISQGSHLVGYHPEHVRWAPDGKHVYFDWKERQEPVEKDFDTYVVDRDGRNLRKLGEEEKKNAPPFRNADWTRDGKRAVYVDDGDVWLYDGTKRRALTRTSEAESNARFTHDERHVVFVRGNNLYQLSLDDGSLEQLTYIAGPDEKIELWDDKDKKKTASQKYVEKEERKLIPWVDRQTKKKEEEEAREKRENPRRPYRLKKDQKVADLLLAPDGKSVFAFLRTEPEKGKKAIVPEYVTQSAYTDTVTSREKVGDELPATTIVRLDVVTGESKDVDFGLGKREVTYEHLLWSDDGTKGVMAMKAVDNKDRWIAAIEPTGKTHTLVTMHDDAWVQREPYGWLRDSARVWFVSEQTGWAHLYTVPWSGGTATALTSGKWEVDGVQLAQDGKSFFLTTSETSPYEHQFWRMPVDGGARVRLTKETGMHEAVASPDGKSIADVFSYVTKPPELYVDGKRVTISPAPEFASIPWMDPPIFEIRARDGAMIPAHVYRPATPLPDRAAVIFVHGAGYLQNVHRGWSDYEHEYMFHNLLAERGFTVLDLDYRGSAGYGRDWRVGIYRHMGGKDLDDEIDGARWLVDHEHVDAKRIGIYGGSYGGFMTLMAMFTAPGVFASGAALRPVTDWAHYNDPYTSNILNRPQDNPEAYRKSSPIYFADGLADNLLICHGVDDTNVHFQDTVRLIERLIELRKENWNVAIYPVENHGFVEPASWADEYKRILKLFETTLK
jgi:dipeptidyl aminopeptidase/acylaminoacyl peptidase